MVPVVGEQWVHIIHILHVYWVKLKVMVHDSKSPQLHMCVICLTAPV